jgi:type I thyroxine 5'-deiodinase
MEQIHQRYGGRAEFLTVYIKEAHPLDEWRMDVNDEQNVCYPQPHSMKARLAIANDFVKRFHYGMPLLVDPIENPASQAYAGWPERFYILDEAGTIVYKGKPGPFGYHPEEVESWLAKRFGEVTGPPGRS